MEKINFQNNVTKANAETMTQFQNNIESAINGILNSVCPIGKIEIFFDNDDHSNYLGFTWERTLIGKTPIGIDSSDNDFNEIGKTMGEKTHTLTIEEMPKHNHSFSYKWKIPSTGSADWAAQNTDASGQLDNVVGYAGGDQPHNNMQPSQVVAYWKRVA